MGSASSFVFNNCICQQHRKERDVAAPSVAGSLRQPAESKLGDVSECIYGGPSLVETRLTCTWTRLHLASFSYAKSIPT